MTHGYSTASLMVTDPEALSELSSLLHDETCSVDDVTHDAVARTLTSQCPISAWTAAHALIGT